MSTQMAEHPPSVPEDSLANRLMLARAMAGHLSIREAALRCGLGRGAWTNWEHGRSEPKVSELQRIAEQLRVKFDWLAGGGPLAHPDGPGGGMGSTGDKRRYFSPKRVRNTRIRPIGRHGIVTQDVAISNAA